jgi:hypothetical protein
MLETDHPSSQEPTKFQRPPLLERPPSELNNGRDVLDMGDSGSVSLESFLDSLASQDPDMVESTIPEVVSSPSIDRDVLDPADTPHLIDQRDTTIDTGAKSRETDRERTQRLIEREIAEARRSLSMAIRQFNDADFGHAMKIDGTSRYEKSGFAERLKRLKTSTMRREEFNNRVDVLNALKAEIDNLVKKKSIVMGGPRAIVDMSKMDASERKLPPRGYIERPSADEGVRVSPVLAKNNYQERVRSPRTPVDFGSSEVGSTRGRREEYTPSKESQDLVAGFVDAVRIISEVQVPKTERDIVTVLDALDAIVVLDIAELGKYPHDDAVSFVKDELVRFSGILDAMRLRFPQSLGRGELVRIDSMIGDIQLLKSNMLRETTPIPLGSMDRMSYEEGFALDSSGRGARERRLMPPVSDADYPHIDSSLPPVVPTDPFTGEPANLFKRESTRSDSPAAIAVERRGVDEEELPWSEDMILLDESDGQFSEVAEDTIAEVTEEVSRGEDLMKKLESIASWDLSDPRVLSEAVSAYSEIPMQVFEQILREANQYLKDDDLAGYERYAIDSWKSLQDGVKLTMYSLEQDGARAIPGITPDHLRYMDELSGFLHSLDVRLEEIQARSVGRDSVRSGGDLVRHETPVMSPEKSIDSRMRDYRELSIMPSSKFEEMSQSELEEESRRIRKAYREVVAKYHPDRVVPSAPQELHDNHEKKYIRVVEAHHNLMLDINTLLHTTENKSTSIEWHNSQKQKDIDAIITHVKGRNPSNIKIGGREVVISGMGAEMAYIDVVYEDDGTSERVSLYHASDMLRDLANQIRSTEAKREATLVAHLSHDDNAPLRKRLGVLLVKEFTREGVREIIADEQTKLDRLNSLPTWQKPFFFLKRRAVMRNIDDLYAVADES